MVPKRRYVVCGPPDRGKTTWVREHARPLDIVWDFDAVLKAIVHSDADLRHDNLPPYLVYLMNDLRTTLVKFCFYEQGLDDVGVFVIVSNRTQAQRLAGTLNAEIIEIG